MATATATYFLRPLVVLLALTAIACADERPQLEDLYANGYRELEWGNLEMAEAAAKQGLRRARDEQRRAWEWAFQVLEAEVLVGERRIGEALNRLDQSLSKDRPVDVVRARALMTRSFAACFRLDQVDWKSEVLAGLDEADRIASALGATKVTVEIKLRRGSCYLLRGDLDTAETLFQETLSMAHRQRLSLLEAYAAGSLSNIKIRTEQYDDAVRWMRHLLDRVSGSLPDGYRAKILGNLGWCYLLLGDYERAEHTLTRVESLMRRLGYTGDRLIVLRNLARTYHRRGDYERAEQSARRSARIARTIEDRVESAEALSNIQVTRAALALEHGRYDVAASRAEEALRFQVEHGLSEAQQRTRLLQGEIWSQRGDLSRASALYNAVIASPEPPPDLVWEARAALARLHARAGRPAEAEAEYRKAFELMESSLAQLLEAELQLPFFANLGRFYDEYVDFLVTQGRVVEALQVADDSRARLLQERLLADGTVPGGAVDYPHLARDLDAPVLFYWTAPERSFLWIITAGGVDLVPLAEEAVLDDLVAAYQSRILASRDPLGEADPAGVELYRRLVEPASAAIASAQRVFIVPDGPLHQLNFETLVLPDPRAHYWIEDVALVRAPSLRLLPAGLESQRATEPSLLGLGDSTAVDEAFPSLPFAGAELSAVAELFEPERRRVYVGPQASPSAYREADPERFTFIHFAAHAQANAVAPLDSAVVLSPEDDEYKLYARDIISIPLDAELVTLSACRSAGGRTFAGEGLVGLSWAFLSAGARNVIGGLWPVEDASTAELMTQLYRELVAGAEPAVALRRAKLELLHSDTAYRKPYYWAPFVVYASRAGGSGQ